MNERITQIVALIVLAGGLVFAAVLTPSINDQRIDRQLTYDTTTGDASNPAYILLSSTGPLRGIFINFAWHRIETLKNEGKFAEANDLAKFIVSLQPRFPGAWEFMAWNMAYNISVKTNTQEERWYWVNNGLNLLRDEGIPNNPRSILLYKQLSWILSHKMGGRTDDMHWYYKRQFAEEWEVVLGAPLRGRQLKEGVPDAPRNQWHNLTPDQFDWDATGQFRDVHLMAETYFRRPDTPTDAWDPKHYHTALSPDARRAFFSDYPGIEQFVRDLGQLRGPAGEELGLGMNAVTLRAFGRLAMLQRAGYNINDPVLKSREGLGLEALAVLEYMQAQNANPEPTAQAPAYYMDVAPRGGRTGNDPIPTDPNNPDATAQPDPARIDIDPLLDLLRAQTLIADYHMDPAYMMWLMDTYGPMDWRHVMSHSLYWSTLGTLMAGELLDATRVDVINNDRQSIHAIQGLAYSGTLAFRPRVQVLGDQGEGVILTMADTRFIEAYGDALERTRERIASGQFGEGMSDKTYLTGRENFLHSAIMYCWFGGQTGLARRYWDQVREEFGSANPDSTSIYKADYETYDLPTFAYLRLTDDDLYDSKVDYLNQILTSAWRDGMIQRDPQVTLRLLNAAHQFYQSFDEDYNSSATPGVDTQNRMDLPDFRILLVQTFLPVITDPTYSLGERASMWEVAAQILPDSETRFQVYAQMVNPLTTQMQLQGIDQPVQSMFLMPRGFVEWAQEQERRLQEQNNNGGTTGPGILRQ